MSKHTLTPEEVEQIVQDNREFIVQSKSPYMKYLIKKPDVTIEIYTTNTVVYRLKSGTKLVKNKPENILFSNQIGSDETGTGDLFGPIIFASAFLDDTVIKKLRASWCFGLITDSKKITDTDIVKIYDEIHTYVPHVKYIILPEKFNQINDQYNLNELKTIGHLVTNNKMYSQCPTTVYVDAFCSLKNWQDYIIRHDLKVEFPSDQLVFETKAESKYASVALASIYARYYLIQWFEQASTELGVELPKGAGSNTVTMYHALKEKNNLANYAKLSWKSIK